MSQSNDNKEENKIIEEIMKKVVMYFGDVDTEFQNTIKENIIDVDRIAQFAYPNVYNIQERKLYVAEKVAYRLNDKNELDSKIIISNQNEMQTLENLIK